MSGRYHHAVQSAALANAGTATFTFNGENVPFDEVAIWLFCKSDLVWSINYVGVYAGAAPADSGTYASGTGPAIVWSSPGILPQEFQPIITITNSSGGSVNYTAIWVGLCFQPHG